MAYRLCGVLTRVYDLAVFLLSHTAELLLLGRSGTSTARPAPVMFGLESGSQTRRVKAGTYCFFACVPGRGTSSLPHSHRDRATMSPAAFCGLGHTIPKGKGLTMALLMVYHYHQW